MKKLLITLLAFLPSLALASSGHGPILEHANVDLTDKAALQRGAALYVNYCLGCHQLQYQRYERTFNDIGIPVDLGLENLVPANKKVGDTITNAMDAESAAEWFGAPPPDLTLVARLKGSGDLGPNWLYTYLKSFYVDPKRPFGVNNEVFPNVGMPHVLMDLQGTPVHATEKRLVDGEMKDMPIGIKATGGSLSAAEYDRAVLDLVTFLAYVGEPSRLESEAIGRNVLWFLLILFALVLLLKKEFWKDVH